MAKKQKDETPSVNATANRDIIQRLNFLYQASVYLQSIAPSSSTGDSGKESAAQDGMTSAVHVNTTAEGGSGRLSQKIRKNGKPLQRKKTSGDLARSYIRTMRLVGQKTTVKIDPSLKRSLCSSCNTTLVPGSSASVRVKKSSCHGNIMVYTCLHCKSSKRIPAPPTSDEVQAADFPTNAAQQSKALHVSEESSSACEQVSLIPSQPPRRYRSKKRRTASHALPLFAREDAGHVVFQGNERLSAEEGGRGVAFG